MNTNSDYKEVNRQSWNNKVDYHIASPFYNQESFMAGANSLKEIELALLGDVRGKSILHLQCHFGQDTISLSRMGASVTGVDISDKAIDTARRLADELQVDTSFVCCDIYDLPQHLDEQYDIVFTSYGTIGWLPDMDRWASIISRYLKAQGRFVFVEFHPVVWMYDDYFQRVSYSYFNTGPIEEVYTGTYADKDAPLSQPYIMWNHAISEVVNSLIQHGIKIQSLHEYDYSPYDCFKHTEQYAPGRYRIAHIGDKIPMVYSVVGEKV